jgi:L-rhamnose mutarotase
MMPEMKRHCFVLQVKPERLEEYRERHKRCGRKCWMRLRETGWRNYSLFLRRDGLLVGYVECEDFEASRAAMLKREVNARWQAEMREFFLNLDGAGADERMRPLEEVFHLE